MEPKPIVELHHFRHPTDEQLGLVDIFFSNYYNLQSVYFEFEYDTHCMCAVLSNRRIHSDVIIYISGH